MSTIQFGGVISGLNTQGIIDALVAVKKQPLTDLQNKEATLTSEKTAYGQVGTALDDLVTKVKAFTTSGAGAARSATSTNSSIVSATASNSAIVASYQVSVDRIATVTRATSTGAIGSAVTGSVNTALTLNAANLATPIKAGQMTINVDGSTVQYTVGNPATTTLQSVIDGLASALQAQIQAQGDGATVAASIVGGQLQLTVSGNGTSHAISLGATGDTSNLAAGLGLDSQSVPGAQNPTITGTAYLDPTLSSLNLPGAVTSGQISAVVDGAIVHYTVGDPSKTTLTQLLNGFSGALQTQMRAGGSNAPADPTAAVTASVVGNRVQLAVSGATTTHSLSFGSAGDASNALGILGLAFSSTTSATNPTVTGSTNLGVVRMTGPLDGAGLSGLTSTKTGVLTINGVAIKYDSTTDSLTSVVTQINNSSAGVIASVDRTNDTLILTRKDTGAAAIDITDTSGNLGSVMKLAPGTTNAQQLGKSAQVTVDGRVITSASNAVTTAIDGVTLNLSGQSATGTTETLTVGVDESAIASSLNDLITSFNALGDLLDRDTTATPGTVGGTAGQAGPLSSDATARSMFLELRDLLFTPSGSGNINSLSALGLNTGAVGSAVGTTNRLQLNTTTLTNALNSDPSKVASLLDSDTGPMAALLKQVDSYEDASNPNAYVQARITGLSTQISDAQKAEANQQEMITNYQAMIEAQYATMEATLSQLQSQSQQIAATLGYTASTSSSSGLSQSSTGSSS